MTEPSKQAWALARKVSWPHLAGQDITWLAAALQPLMDERDGANAGYCEPLEQMRQRAEAAEADAALAWRRVTELQARGTQLVLEHRAAIERHRTALGTIKSIFDALVAPTEAKS